MSNARVLPASPAPAADDGSHSLRAGRLGVIGIVFFSGSLFIMAFTGMRLFHH